MVRHCASFLLRCWTLGQNRWRIEITHVQSGERTQVDSLPDAIAWMRTRAADPPIASAPSSGQSATAREKRDPLGGLPEEGEKTSSGQHEG